MLWALSNHNKIQKLKGPIRIERISFANNYAVVYCRIKLLYKHNSKWEKERRCGAEEMKTRTNGKSNKNHVSYSSRFPFIIFFVFSFSLSFCYFVFLLCALPVCTCIWIVRPDDCGCRLSSLHVFVKNEAKTNTRSISIQKNERILNSCRRK